MAQVLIIDSEAAAAKALSDALAAQGVASQVTGDGTEGLERAKTARPDVIVLCVELARGSGYSVCNKLKKDPDLSSIPLLLTSSQATEETFEQHKKLRTRAEAYLKKPYTEAEILGQLATYVPLRTGRGAAPVASRAAAEVEVSVDDMAIESEASGARRLVASHPDQELLDVSFESEVTHPATDMLRAAKAPPPARVESADSASLESPRRTTASVVRDAESERLRHDVQQLRQKVQKLEHEMQEKEVQFNDRLLEESQRGREAVELKKKLGQVEREIAKHQQAAERAQSEAQQAAIALRQAKDELAQSEAQQSALADKVEQLVDKVKQLAAERDELRGEAEQSAAQRQSVSSEVETAQRVREKARKAVDIALQLLNETGLQSGGSSSQS